MPDLPCPEPTFEYLTILNAWSWCRVCGRPAWSHEQADPLQDMRNFYTAKLSGLSMKWYPPAMKEL